MYFYSDKQNLKTNEAFSKKAVTYPLLKKRKREVSFFMDYNDLIPSIWKAYC